MMSELKIWRIEDGWLLSQADTKLARVEGADILLYDKRTHTEVRISLAELIRETNLLNFPALVDVSHPA